MTMHEREVVYFGLHAAALVIWFILAARKFPWPVSVLIVIAAAVNGAGWGWKWLDRVPHYDDFAHAYCTFALTVPAALRINRGRKFDLRTAFATLGVGVTGSVLWELYEWTIDQYVTRANTMSLSDTLGDLSAGLVGALVAIPVCWALSARRRVRRAVVHHSKLPIPPPRARRAVRGT